MPVHGVGHTGFALVNSFSFGQASSAATKKLAKIQTVEPDNFDELTDWVRRSSVVRNFFVRKALYCRRVALFTGIIYSS